MRVADRISPDHPALRGHFPGRPIAPAVVLLQHLEESVESLWPDLRVIGLDRGKFIAPAPLGREFEIDLQPLGADQVSAKVWVGQSAIFSGVLRVEDRRDER